MCHLDKSGISLSKSFQIDKTPKFNKTFASMCIFFIDYFQFKRSIDELLKCFTVNLISQHWPYDIQNVCLIKLTILQDASNWSNTEIEEAIKHTIWFPFCSANNSILLFGLNWSWWIENWSKWSSTHSKRSKLFLRRSINLSIANLLIANVDRRHLRNEKTMR